MAWTKEEVKNFESKDLRISRLAIIKSLIEKLSKEDIYEVDKVTDLTEKYIDYVYSERKETTKRGQAGCVAGSTKLSCPEWEQAAKGLNLAIPSAANIKILSQVMDEYKKANKASANPSDILSHIIGTYGKYPEKQGSVKTILESLK